MESFAVDKSLYDIEDHDLKEFWEPAFDSPIHDAFGSDQDWTNILDNQPVILNDRMITDAAQSPRIQSEHSYSLSVSDDMPGSPLGLHDRFKMEEDFGKDLEADCFGSIPMDSRSSEPQEVHIKQEPLSAPSSPQPLLSSSPFTCLSPYHAASGHQHHHSNGGHAHRTLLKQPTIVLATTKSSSKGHAGRQLFSKVSVKVEPTHSAFGLPPTPPSSNSSDSEGSLSPIYSQQPSSPPNLLTCPLSSSSSTSSSSSSSSLSSRRHGSQTRTVGSVGTAGFLTGGGPSKNNFNSPLISSQPKGATGLLLLTEEEKRTLVAEGYPVPTRLPLTKSEEKSLKKIRRKIKNKISAQESRRKKKEYMDALEKKVENLAHENCDYKRRVDSLESNNKSLLSQLHKLQAMLGELPNKMSRTVCTQTSNSVMPKRVNSKSGRS